MNHDHDLFETNDVKDEPLDSVAMVSCKVSLDFQVDLDDVKVEWLPPVIVS